MMHEPPMECLTDETVFAFVEGRLGADAARAVDEHLRGCAECRVVVAEATKAVLGGSAAPAAPAPPRDPPPLAAGTAVSRYVIARPIGAGGAGVVYEAYDPELRRKVALKLLRPLDEVDPVAARERLLREAQAMAQLSHPNVVPVFDAGTYGGQVFIVMELVGGQTLAAWLRRGQRSWREVLNAFVDGARGLAAAHAAQIVHRDFKPDNVLLGADGRVRVTDFGLARPESTASVAITTAAIATASIATASIAPSSSSPSAPFTTMAGTPAYMAPEQFQTGTADARSDQFNFCVALYLALFGRHPFAEPSSQLGKMLALIGDLAGAAFPPLTDEPPASLRDVLRRGLAPRPEDRFASMEDLIAALSAHAATKIPRRTLIALAAGATAFVALIVAAVLHVARPPAASCGDGIVRRGVEECDDGNTRDDDGCSSSCLLCRRGNASFVWEKNGHCYSRHDEPLTWKDAREACAAVGADLITYTGFYEALAVRAKLLLPQPASSWIGLGTDAAGRLSWLGHEQIDNWVSWGNRHPPPRSCAYQEPDKLRGRPSDHPGVRWRAISCDETHGYICEQNPWIVRPNGHHAYRVDTFPRTWIEAERACAAGGAHLVTVTDDEEHSFVAGLALVDLWIGANESEQEGQFQWINGEPFRYQRFAPGEPDDRSHNGNCTVVGADEQWHDRGCTSLYASVCESDRLR